ncbi:hypothetical protein [Streptomyces sp. NPDC048172]|uniref:hypothetical protein n=1 Tax=Streptomyces sp. NPDC048172 TaxID=3365505 RepID=UPI003721FA81
MAITSQSAERITAPARGTYVADTSPESMSPPSDPWIVRIQTALRDGMVRVVTPHGTEWTVHADKLRAATPVERRWFDSLVPRTRRRVS